MFNSIVKQLTKQLVLPLGSAICFVCITSCSSGLAEVYPDQGDEIKMSVHKGISSRAEGDYRNWDSALDPSTMGVIAFTNQGGTPANPDVFANACFNAPSQGGTIWTTAEQQLWSSYSDKSLDFFAYMPHKDRGVSLSQSGTTYTLTLQDVPGISSEPYLVAHIPVHYGTDSPKTGAVSLQFDQLMTAFEFQFMLGDDMSALRTFKITKVEMSGVPATATVKQDYSFASTTWSKGTTDISGISSTSSSAYVQANEESAIKVGYPDNSQQFKSFPKNLYMLPFKLVDDGGNAILTPTIYVTYDVYDQDGYKTRSAIRSSILLSKTNFTAIANPSAAAKRLIQIKIVPNSLKVLSDADQSTSGYLVVGE